MIDGALIISSNVATSCVLVAHVTSELEIRIHLAHVSGTEARLRDYDQHFRIAIRKTALPYTVR